MPSRARAVGSLARGAVGLGVVAAIFFFLVRGLISNWSDLKSEDIDVQPALVLLSVIPGIGGILLMSLAWIRLVAHLGGPQRFPAGQLQKAFLYSWIGRYIPGKVAYVVGRFYLGRSVGVPSPVLVGSIAYENVLLLVVAAGFASLTIVPSLAIAAESVLPYLALPALALAGCVVLHPKVLGVALRVVMRVLGREAAEPERLLPPRQIAKAMALYALAFAIAGAGLYLLIISVTPYSPRYLPLVAGTYALAGVVGMVSVFAPGGIGVREGVLVAVFQTTMPVELAILLSFVARIWATGVDVLIVAGCLAYDQVSGDRLLVTTIRGREGAVADAESSDAHDS